MTISSELISLFWSKRTLTHPGLLLLQCLLFGLVIGLLQLKVGANPKTIKQILAEFQETGKVDGASWRTWVNGTIILAGGASVGPEASMTGIIARQSSAMGQHCVRKFSKASHYFPGNNCLASKACLFTDQDSPKLKEKAKQKEDD